MQVGTVQFQLVIVISPVFLSPSSLNFSPQPLNTTSHRQKVTLINNSSATVTISDIEFSAGFASGIESTCQVGTEVSAGGTCIIYVKFTPTATGTTNGTLTVTDDAGNSPQPVTLTGMDGCNANPFPQTGLTQSYGQWQAPSFVPPSAEWFPPCWPGATTGCQVEPSEAPANGVPQYLGFLPTPNPAVNVVKDYGSADTPYALCPTHKSGCALTSAATMLSSFGNTSITPAQLDAMLKNPANTATITPAGYGTAFIQLCTVDEPNCKVPPASPDPPFVPYNDWCEFLWTNLPLAVSDSIEDIASEQLIMTVITGATSEPSAWDNDKFFEGEVPTVGLDQYLADYACADTDQYATPPPSRTLSPPAGVILQLKHLNSNGQHFVVVTGRTSDDLDWTLFDPGWSETQSPPLNTLSAHLDGFYNGTTLEWFGVIGTRTYQSTGGGAWFAGTANSPIELLVTDPTGRQLGNLNGSDVFGVPYGSYTRDFQYNDDDSGGLANGDPTGIKGFNIPSPPDGTYQVVATGTGYGPYTLTFTAVASDGTAQQTIATGTASPGVAVTYQVTYSTTPGAPFTVTGTSPVASLSTSSLTFPGQIIGSTSSAQAVTIDNIGNAPLALTSIAVSGGFGQTNNCGASLAVSGSCTLNVTFSPTATGPLTGTLTITDNSSGVADSTQTVSLTGTGTAASAPAVSLSSTALTFPSQIVNTTSAGQPVTLTNTGSATLTISGIAGVGDFAQTNNCLPSVAAGANCAVNVTFTPLSAGSLAGSVTITDNALGSPQIVTLQGTATLPPVPFVNQPLVPMSVAPGGPAFTLTVNGAGFSSGSVVNWNGSPRNTTFVSAIELTAQIDGSDISRAGTAYVTVTNPAASTVASNSVPLQIANPEAAISFQSSTIALANSNPQFVTTADFNGDGHLDLAVAEGNTNTVAILLGNGDGTFQSPVNYPVGVWPVFVAVGDFNGDGTPDLAIANISCTLECTQASVSILLGNGDGTFRAGTTLATNDLAESIAVGDFNRDGVLDLAVVSGYAPAHVSIFFGNGDGTFSPGQNFQVGPNIEVEGGMGTVMVGDFNQDGKLDLAVVGDSTSQPSDAPFSGSGVFVLLGNGDGTFQPQVMYPLAASASTGTVAALGGNAKLDLAIDTGFDGTGGIAILPGNGDGTFSAEVEYAAALPVGAGGGIRSQPILRLKVRLTWPSQWPSQWPIRSLARSRSCWETATERSNPTRTFQCPRTNIVYRRQSEISTVTADQTLFFPARMASARMPIRLACCLISPPRPL
jgi:hypothetical protein